MARKRVRGKWSTKGVISAAAIGGGYGLLTNARGISKHYQFGGQMGALGKFGEELGKGAMGLGDAKSASRIVRAGKLGGLKAAGRFGGKAALAGAVGFGAAYAAGVGIRAAVNKAKESKDTKGKVESESGASSSLEKAGRWVTARGRHIFIPDKKGAKAVVKRAKGK